MMNTIFQKNAENDGCGKSQTEYRRPKINYIVTNRSAVVIDVTYLNQVNLEIALNYDCIEQRERSGGSNCH